MGYGDIRDVIKQYSFIKYPLDYSNVTGYTSVSGYSWVIAPNYFLTMLITRLDISISSSLSVS